MARRSLLTLALALLAAACREEAPPGKPVWSNLAEQSRAREAHSAPSGSPSAAPPKARVAPPLTVEPLPATCDVSDRVSALAAGDEVLVSPVRVNFVLARVKDPGRGGPVVVVSRHGNAFEAPPEQVYALRPAHRTRAKPGCYGACNPGSGWVPCLVTRAEGATIRARDRAGRALALVPSEVLVFDAPVQKLVRDFFSEAAYEQAFREAVGRAGRPRPPPAFAPTLHDVVLARFGDKYLPAQVEQSGGTTATVRWLTSSMDPVERPVAELIPFPDGYGAPAVVAPGDFVLAHARGATAKSALTLATGSDAVRAKLPEPLPLEWEPMRVAAVYPDGRLLLADASRKEHPSFTNKVVAYR